MIVLLLSVLALLSSVTGLCYSPVLHGFAPDVILPSMLSSDIYCPPPHVFDHFHCMCVDASVVKVRVPTEGRTSLELSLLNRKQPTSNPPFRLASPMAGLPDMHVPGSSHRWPAVTPLQLNPSGRRSLGRPRVVPVLNPYGSFNLPAKSKLVKETGRVQGVEATVSSNKQQELLEKARWQERLQREAAAVAAAELAAASAAAAAASAVPETVRHSTLDLFMRETLRRILYGY